MSIFWQVLDGSPILQYLTDALYPERHHLKRKLALLALQLSVPARTSLTLHHGSLFTVMSVAKTMLVSPLDKQH